MGIKGLTKFIADVAPNAIKEIKIENLMGRVIAIDASMSLYQFIIAIRDGDHHGNLTNESGETTSHISGLMSRSIRLMENGLKPVYVFDGAPPDLKGSELEKRGERRNKAEELLKKAKEEGDLEEIKKQSGRIVRVTKKQNEEAKRLLRLMGIPVVEAPCEAESQCAFLTKYDLAHATATEDADALVFGTKILIRNLNANATSASQSKNKNNSKRGFVLTEINLEQVLSGLNLSMGQFIDFCILCGCDYCDTIKGIGSKTAYNLIKEYNTIENIIEHIDKNKYQVPSNFRYEEARQSFVNPKVLAKEEVKLDWNEPQVEELKNFLVKEYNFNETRVQNYINRLLKAKKATTQKRLDNFFTTFTKKSTKLVMEEAKKEETKKKGKAGVKREADKKTPKANKKAKTEKKDVKENNKTKSEIKEESAEVKEEMIDEPEDNMQTNNYNDESNDDSGKCKAEKDNESNEQISTYNGSVADQNDNNINVKYTHRELIENQAQGVDTLENNNNNNNNNDSVLDSSVKLNASFNSSNNKNFEKSNPVRKNAFSFLLPYCPKNVTNVKKKKSVQKC